MKLSLALDLLEKHKMGQEHDLPNCSLSAHALSGGDEEGGLLWAAAAVCYISGSPLASVGPTMKQISVCGSTTLLEMP